MKIIFSGYHNPGFFTITEYIERAVTALGHRLYPFDDRMFVFPGRLRSALPLLQTLDLRQLNRRLFRLAVRKKPDLLIVTGGHRILKRTVQKVKALGIKTALWTTDAPLNFAAILNAAPFYDHLFCQGTEAVELLAANGIPNAHWLPMACSPDLHHRVELAPDERQALAHDVVFVGSYYPNRAELFEKLTSFDFAIWGPGWHQVKESSGLIKCLKGAHTLPALWRKIYSGAKIVLATHYQNPEMISEVHQASPRVFEAMACGAFLITDAQKDALSLFKKGKHLEGYKDSNDLQAKIRYFLKHPEERNRIAHQGKQEVLSKHTYIKRVDSLLSVVQEAASNK